jgi:tripartite-type tricarboxylate transporter receptor subunit TctC
VHVPYRGGAPGTTDLTGGTVPVMSLSMAAPLLELHAAGKIRILCVNAPERLAIAPDIPTAAEAGYPGMVVQVFNGIFAPASTPKPILDRIARESQKAMATDEVKAVLGAAGATIVSDSTPESAARFVKEERERWTPIIKASGIELR